MLECVLHTHKYEMLKSFKENTSLSYRWEFTEISRTAEMHDASRFGNKWNQKPLQIMIANHPRSYLLPTIAVRYFLFHYLILHSIRRIFLYKKRVKYNYIYYFNIFKATCCSSTSHWSWNNERRYGKTRSFLHLL